MSLTPAFGRSSPCRARARVVVPSCARRPFRGPEGRRPMSKKKDKKKDKKDKKKKDKKKKKK